MKINKNIAKILTIGLLLNNLSVLSNATLVLNNEIPNRYQSYEGENVIIDNNNKGTIHEIEIFGNTVKNNENNDIQSVGDLYVDENGNPILDKQGREQYQIKIISETNLFDIENADNLPIIKYNYAGHSSFNIIQLKPNTTYNISVVKSRETSGSLGYSYITNSTLDDAKFIIRESSSLGSTGVTTVTTNDDGELWISRYSTLLWDYADIMIVETNSKSYIEYVPYQKSEISILLPCQLQKVNNIRDRLYWDSSKSKYIIEKRFGTVLVDGNTTIRNYISANTETTSRFYTQSLNPKGANRGATLSTIFNNKIISGENWCYLSPNNQIDFNIRNDIVDIGDINSFSEWLGLNNVFVIYELEESQFIETNIVNKINPVIFNNFTQLYIKTYNNIYPTLKITVDRINTLSQESVDTAESEPTIYNLSRARIMVNQMEEGELKEQLQQRLNNISTLNDLELEKKNTTSNVDIYIKSENMLSMTLSTNSITFEDYSGVDEVEINNAIEISINSSLPYQLNAYLISDIQNADGSNKIDIDKLNIKDSSETDYKEFISISNKLILKDNCLAGNDKSHTIDFKLKGDYAYPSDIYKAVIKFEAEQK